MSRTLTSLRRPALALVVAAGTAAAVVLPGSAAHAGTVHRLGLKISTPANRTVYNGRQTSITASAHPERGIHKQMISSVVLAYANGRLIRKAHTISVPAGSYALATRVVYRPYKFVTRHRTTRKWHPGAYPSYSRCVVTAIRDNDGDGVGYAPSAADCTNPKRPGQTVHAHSPMDNRDRSQYTVGQVFYSNYVWFKGYAVYTKVPYTARKYLSRRGFTTATHPLTVHDGGYRRVFTGTESLTTKYFTVPHSNWFADYQYDCGSYSGNWIVDLHRQGGSVLDDVALDNVIRYGGSGRYRFTGAGTYRFDIITECNWEIVVRSPR